VRATSEPGRDRRSSGQALRPQEDELPVGKLAERAHDGPRERALGGPPLEHDELSLLRGTKQIGVDALGDDPVLARKALRRGVGRFGGRRHERIDAREELLALRLAGRIAEALRGEEARHAQRAGVPQREVRQARQARLEPVHDVERAAGERRRQVRADADRKSDAAPAGDRDRGPERDQRRLSAVAQRAPAGREVRGPVRRSKHADRVATLPQGVGDARDVLVHVVRLRPRKRRDQANSKGHEGFEFSPLF